MVSDTAAITYTNTEEKMSVMLFSTQAVCHTMPDCSAKFEMLAMEDNPSPPHPSSKQGQANECSYMPEVIGGGGVAFADYWASLMKTASGKKSWVNQGMVW